MKENIKENQNDVRGRAKENNGNKKTIDPKTARSEMGRDRGRGEERGESFGVMGGRGE